MQTILHMILCNIIKCHSKCINTSKRLLSWAMIRDIQLFSIEADSALISAIYDIHS